MTVDGDHDSSVLSNPSSQGVPSPHKVADLPVNDRGDSSFTRAMDSALPLGHKPTYYRLLVATSAALWAVPKAVWFYRDRSIEVTTLDLFASLFGVVLYWVGLHEARRREGWDWFFKDELAPTFGMYFLSRAEWALSFLCDMLVLHPFISIFLIGACLLLTRNLPNWGTAIVSIGLTVPVLIIFMSLLVRATSGRTQSHTR